MLVVSQPGGGEKVVAKGCTATGCATRAGGAETAAIDEAYLFAVKAGLALAFALLTTAVRAVPVLLGG